MKFSIVIPNYNSEKWIFKCIESIQNQTYKNFEIIFVDDMSTDNSVDIAKILLTEKDKLIINKTKRLNGGTRNVGIAESSGDYIICLDCDDYLQDNKVLEDINNQLNGEDILFLGYIYHTVDSDMPTVLKYDNLEEAFKDTTCAIWTKAVRAELLKSTPFPEGTLFEDRIQHYKLLLKSKTFICLGRTTHIWNRLNEKSICNRDDYIDYRFAYCGELYKLIKKIDNKKLKDYLIKELKNYLNSCNELVEQLNE